MKDQTGRHNMKQKSNDQTHDPNLFSILVPVYNEEETVDAFFERIDPVIAQIKKQFGYDVELIFTDNASEDGTYEKIVGHAKSRPDVRIFRFSKNVGFQRSIISGYAFTRGAACVQIDCDLEDPPELIIQFIEKWREGYKVVYGQRNQRKENWLMRSLRTLFYKTINFLSEADIPLHAGDFRLIDRRIIDIVCQINDAEPYLRGLIANLGFKQVGVQYNRAARFAGKSSFNMRSYATLAIEGVLQSSIKPLNFSLILAVLVLLFSISLGIYYIVGKLSGNLPPDTQGFTTLAVLILFQFSFLLLVIGINSLYLGRVYRQVFRRPISIMEQTNVDDHSEIKNTIYWPSEPLSSSENERFLSEK